MKSAWFRGVETEVTLHWGFIREKRGFLQKSHIHGIFIQIEELEKEGKWFEQWSFYKKDAIYYTGIQYVKRVIKWRNFLKPLYSHFVLTGCS